MNGSLLANTPAVHGTLTWMQCEGFAPYMQGEYIGLSGFYVVAQLLALVHPGQGAVAHSQYQKQQQQQAVSTSRMAARKYLRPWRQEGTQQSPATSHQLSLSMSELQALGQQLCAMSWGDLHGHPEVGDQANLEKYCLWGQYVAELVGQHGLQLSTPGNSFSLGGCSSTAHTTCAIVEV